MTSSTIEAPPRRASGRRALTVVRHVVPLVLLVLLVMRVGADPFLLAGRVLTPLPIAAALLLGVVTTTAQALRWRTVAQAYGTAGGLTRTRAVQECYRSAFLNTALPGGLAGDALRVWRRGADHHSQDRSRDHSQDVGAAPGRGRALRRAAGSVVVERAVGTALLLLATAAAAFPVDRRLCALALVTAAVATAVAVPGMARLSTRARTVVLGWSVLAMASLMTKVAVAASALGTVHGIGTVLGLAVFLLAGGSVPLGFGGFGPRETAAAYAFTGLGLTAEAGVATSVAYGLLAVVSVLPGAPVMLLDPRRLGRGRPVPDVEVSR